MKAPYTFPERTRAKMAGYIAYGCGRAYCSRDGTFPLHYNVKAYMVELDFGHLFAKYAEEHMPSLVKASPSVRDAYKALAMEAYTDLDQDTLWNWGVEEAWRSVDDGDTYRMVWDSDHAEKVEFFLLGRGGGHLCVREINGLRMDRNGDVLYKILNNREEITMKDLRVMYKLAVQWNSDFTGVKASQEIEYQAAFQFFVNVVNNKWDQHVARVANHKEIVESARLISGVVASAPEGVKVAFQKLHEAAGVLGCEVEGYDAPML